MLAKSSGEWIGERELTIVVGINAAVSAESNGSATTCSTEESCVVLADGAVRTEALAILSSVGSTPVLPPDNPPAVSAVVFAPQVRTAEETSPFSPPAPGALGFFQNPKQCLYCEQALVHACITASLCGRPSGEKNGVRHLLYLRRMYPSLVYRWAHETSRPCVPRRTHAACQTPGINASAPPQSVGLCGEFTLDGRASLGAASRTLSAAWSVSPTTDGTGDAAALAAVESALAPHQGALLATLNATSLEIGIGFTFTLSVGNFLGAGDRAEAAVTRT